ncbi:MAG: hypothetical protein ACKVS9_18645 [Phycisphaerae bacterium]
MAIGAGCARIDRHDEIATPEPDSLSSESNVHSWDEAQTACFIEQELADWSPSVADAQAPPEYLRNRSVAIEGVWIGRTDMDYASMTITRRADNNYDVEFVTGGSLSSWCLKRTASYRDGVLTLDRPVREYCPITFKSMFTIQVDGKELLLPASTVSEFLPDVDADGNSRPRTIGVSFYTYGRRADRLANERPSCP